MKKISLILLALVIFQFVNGQTNVFPTTGNVGIGTVAPLRLLEVNLGSNLATFGGKLPIGNFSGIEFGYFEPTNLSYRKSALVFERLDGAARGKVHILNNGSDSPSSATLNDARLTINYDGNVGIGTTAPKAKLDITGGIAIQSLLSNTSLRPPASASKIPGEIRGYSNTSDQSDDGFLRLSAGAGTNPAVLSYIDLSSYSTLPDMNMNIVMGTNGLERIRIANSGNVGIGISTPSEKLSVNGNIRAKEIRVENANWPDYVFSKDYKLRNLQAVEKHINKEGYLPDMPSAKDVEQNGINVSEMNAKLLKKIEELTLYVIELNKKSSSQEEKVENLQKEVRMLKQKNIK